MKNLKKAIAVVLCLVTMLYVMSIFISATSISASLGNEAENSGDYAYWNGSKVVKSSSTSKDEIKWMQKALNYCINNRGLSATKLTVDGSFGPASKKATIAFQKATGLSADGSFGPATIQKMKNILNNGNKNSLKVSSAYIKVYSNTSEINSLNLKGNCQNLSLYVKSSSQWKVSSNASWLNVYKSNGNIVIKTTLKLTTGTRTGTITITNNEGIKYNITVKQYGNTGLKQYGDTKNPISHEHLDGKYRLVSAVTDSADWVLVSVWVCSTCGWINCDTANIWTIPNGDP